MRLVGLYSSSSGHGKDTVARLLLNNTMTIPDSYRLVWREILNGQRLHILDYSLWEIKKFATAPKKIVADMYNVPITKLEDRDWRLQPQPPFSKPPLHLVIDIAQKMKEIINEDVWKDVLFNQYTDTDRWVISDVRFPCEYEEIKKRGGIMIKIERPGCQAPRQVMDGLLDAYEFDERLINEDGKWIQMVTDLHVIIKKYKLNAAA